MANDYALALGSRLRAIRQQQNLSLQGVEEKSGGVWKAVVVGSYERGDRSITVSKLAALAEFYGVPVVELLPGAGGSAKSAAAAELAGIVIDLPRLRELPEAVRQPLLRYTEAIQAQRGDYNGRVLSIRQEDLRVLALMYDLRPEQLAQELASWGALATPAGAPMPPAQRTAEQESPVAAATEI